MRFLTAKPLIVVCAIYLNTVHGATQLTQDNAEVSFNTDTTGMPIDATIAYASDLGVAAESSAPETLWVDVSTAIGGTAAAYYTATPMLAGPPSATDFSVILGRNTVEPLVGDYTVIVKIKLMYKNAANELLMDEAWYTFDVNVAGAESTSTITTAGNTANNGAFTKSQITDETAGSGSVASSVPASLVLVQMSKNNNLSNDLVLQAKVTDASDIANYNLWIVPNEPIWMSIDEFYEDADDYEWPDLAARSTQEEELSGISSVNIKLKSIPTSFFNAETAYVQLTVHFRDESNDARRRGLRELQDGAEASELQVSSTKLVTKIHFKTDVTDVTDATDVIMTVPSSPVTTEIIAVVAVVVVIVVVVAATYIIPRRQHHHQHRK